VIYTTLEDYLRKELHEGKIDFTFRATAGNDDRVHIYIHPLNAGGETTPPLLVKGNLVVLP
jgi:hypothetical protein